MVGEHIRTRKGGRWNHAIDCGDETVIHLSDAAPGPPRVRRSYRLDFVAGAEAVEVVTHRERTYPAKEVVARAYSRIADPALAAMFHDSEAFAEWCATGRLPLGRAGLAAAEAVLPTGSAAPAAAPTAQPAPAAAPAAAGPSEEARPAAKRARPAARTARRRKKARATAKRPAAARKGTAGRAKPRGGAGRAKRSPR